MTHKMQESLKHNAQMPLVIKWDPNITKVQKPEVNSRSRKADLTNLLFYKSLKDATGLYYYNILIIY